MTCTVVKGIKLRESSIGYGGNWVTQARNYITAEQIRTLPKQWDSFPANELRVGHLDKHLGTPETVRPKFPLA